MLARPWTVVAITQVLANHGSGRPVKVSFEGQGSRPATGQGCLFIWVVLYTGCKAYVRNSPTRKALSSERVCDTNYYVVLAV